jgi:hypothetical protein
MLLLPITIALAAACGCEEQSRPVSAAATSQQDGDEVDMDALRRPGTGDYYGALAGAKRTAENTVDKIDKYNEDLEKKMDELFDE